MKKIAIVANSDTIISDLILLKNKAFCSHTLQRARRLLRKLQDKLSEQEYRIIENYINNIDINNPDVWEPEWARKGDYKHHIMYARGEFSAYIDKLINEKKASQI